jgi:hypothetical protein
MRCLTKIESEEWVKSIGFPVDPANPSSHIFRVSGQIPKDHGRLTWFSNLFSNSFIEFEFNSSCLLWVTEFGIWSHSENLHLFYRLRQTYFEYRLLHEAPGDFFLKHEAPDLSSFISVALICGWGFHLHPSPCRIRGFLSHDEWFYVEADDERELSDLKRRLKESDFAYETSVESK